MSFADIFDAFSGGSPATLFKEPVTCPTCHQPARQAYLGWLQPCGDHVGDDWIRDALAKERTDQPPTT